MAIFFICKRYFFVVGCEKKGNCWKMKESELQKLCTERLLKHPEVYGWRNNTGAVKTGKRFIKYGFPGSPDFIGLLSNGRFIGVEFKSEKGKQSENQIRLEKEILQRRGIYKVISDLEQFEIFYRNLFVLCKP